jgi:hypothetical protein
MFAEWVTHGAEIGVVAFFAVVVFLMFCAAIIGILGLAAKVFEDVGDKKEG